MDRFCEGCGKPYWFRAAWQHEKCATNTATNKVHATNAPIAALSVPIQKEAVVAGQVSVRTMNRRSREAYNAYQRDLMRKRRAEAKTS